MRSGTCAECGEPCTFCAKERYCGVCRQRRRRASKAAYMRRWGAKNRATKKTKNDLWAARNPHLMTAYKAIWKARNPAKVAADAARRRSVALQAMPAWLTAEQRQEIDSWYVLARAFGGEVDHKIPLRGRNVSGLHVPWNLQILPRAENAAKSNKVVDTHL